MSTESTTEQQAVADDPVVDPVADKAPEENAADDDNEYVKCNSWIRCTAHHSDFDTGQ